MRQNSTDVAPTSRVVTAPAAKVARVFAAYGNTGEAA